LAEPELAGAFVEAPLGEPPDVGLLPPGEVGVVAPPEVVAGGLEGGAPLVFVPPVKQESPLPATTPNTPVVAVRPLLSLMVKRSWLFSVALTVHVCCVPVSPLKVATAVVCGLVSTLMK
jgi:hypothetical protein